ncbi:hypothetical protein NAK90_002052 [Salmonella enterica]|nr:hypothetical protein [Salmonella enterica]EDE6687005.1 hypothetical protein [Salmonella enterica subsp. enterica serovar Apeyeme]EDW0699419.1 hypothetical protein [Salmonella enterica subsp. enterica]EGS2622014.1 hypothetical protein [Salmonella enterica]EIG9527195.1 hypothetical protein [Salmonella enterica]
MVKTHTGTVIVETALGKIRKKVRFYRTEKAWVVTAGETYSPETGQRNGGTVRAGVLLLDSIRALPVGENPDRDD